MSVPVTRSMSSRTDSGEAGGTGGCISRTRHWARAAARRRLASRPKWRMRTNPSGTMWSRKRSEKLVDVEVQDLHAISIGVVAPAKADAAVREAEEAVVGECHAVRVA